MYSGAISIIGNPKGESWTFTSKIFEILKQKGSCYELNEVNFKEFRDGEFKPKITKNIRGKCCFYMQDSNINPSRWMAEIALVNEALVKSSAGEIIDVFPYLKFSRQDRKDESRVSISARVVADVISKYADAVITLDVHNPTIDGFYDIRFDNLYSFRTAVDHIKSKHPEILENLVVMSPDVGGSARANSFANKLGIEDIAIGVKKRKMAGEVDSLKIIGDVEGKNLILVDDIVDSGNTIIKACKVAKKQGAKKVYGYCTHGLFTEGIDKVADNFDLFFVGDTIAQKTHPKIEIISFAPLFAEAIYRITNGESLSALFD